MSKIYTSIDQLIGNTPLLKFNRIVPEDAADVYVETSVWIFPLRQAADYAAYANGHAVEARVERALAVFVQHEVGWPYEFRRRQSTQ